MGNNKATCAYNILIKFPVQALYDVNKGKWDIWEEWNHLEQITFDDVEAKLFEIEKLYEGAVWYSNDPNEMDDGVIEFDDGSFLMTNWNPHEDLGMKYEVVLSIREGLERLL